MHSQSHYLETMSNVHCAKGVSDWMNQEGAADNSQKGPNIKNTGLSFKQRVLADLSQAERPSIPGLLDQTSAAKGHAKENKRGSMVVKPSDTEFIIPPHEFFRGVNPPAAILDAYTRLNEGWASDEDERAICEFRVSHCFDLILAEKKPVEVSCVVFDPEIYDAMHQDELYRNERLADRYTQKQVGRKVDKENKGQLKESDKAAPKQIKKNDIAVASKEPEGPCWRRVRPAEDDSSKQSKPKRINGVGDFQDYTTPSLKTVPQNEALKQAQLQIVSRIVNQIAEQSSTTIAESDKGSKVVASTFSRPSILKPKSGKARSDRVTIEPSSTIDWNLEIHAAAIHKLLERLGDGSFKAMNVTDKQGKQLRHDEKYDCLEGLLLITERSFEEIVGELTSQSHQYKPSGKTINETDLEDLLEEYISTFDMLRDCYPKMKICHIIKAFKKLGNRAKLANIY